MKIVPPSLFSKDHWSLLAYLETCAVDDRGRIDRRRMRCNAKRRPSQDANGMRWQSRWGTVIEGGKMLPQHDDWDCLDDLEAAGYVHVLSEANCLIGMTPVGQAVAATLRAHRANGGQFSTFNLS